MKLYRVHTDPNKPMGRFMAREREIGPFLNDPDALRVHLGLPDVPIYITDVHVPAGSELLVGRIGPHPSFGLVEESGFQYQAISNIPKSSFVNTKPILDPGIGLGIGN